MIPHRPDKTSDCLPFVLLLLCRCMERRNGVPAARHATPSPVPDHPPTAVVNRICTAREKIENCAHHVFLEQGESALVVNTTGDMVIFRNMTSGRICACLTRLVEIAEK